MKHLANTHCIFVIKEIGALMKQIFSVVSLCSLRRLVMLAGMSFLLSVEHTSSCWGHCSEKAVSLLLCLAGLKSKHMSAGNARSTSVSLFSYNLLAQTISPHKSFSTRSASGFFGYLPEMWKSSKCLLNAIYIPKKPFLIPCALSSFFNPVCRIILKCVVLRMLILRWFLSSKV